LALGLWFLFVLVRVISWIVSSQPKSTIHEFIQTNTNKDMTHQRDKAKAKTIKCPNLSLHPHYSNASNGREGESIDSLIPTSLLHTAAVAGRCMN